MRDAARVSLRGPSHRGGRLRRVPLQSQLTSGPRVVTVPHPGGACAVYVRFDAGAADERPGEYGVAHLLEHMLFKGTATRGIGAHAREVEALGGDLNAWTSHDELVLHAEVPGDAWDVVLHLLADMVTEPRLDAEELERERIVVLEELSSYEDDPDESLSDTVQAAFWGEHPYGRPVIGARDTVAALTVEHVRSFLQRELTASRLTVLVVGDVDHDEVVGTVERCFAPLPHGKARQAPEPARPVDGPLVVRTPHRFDDRATEWVFPAPPIEHPDRPALHVLAALLGPTAGDRISEALDEEPKAGFAGWADVFDGRFGASFHLGFRALDGTADVAASRVAHLLRSVSRGVRGRRCARARDTLVADLAFAEQTADGLAEELLLHLAPSGDVHARAAWRDALSRVGPEDVRRAAARWLDPTRAAIGLLGTGWSAPAMRRVVSKPRREVASRTGPIRHELAGCTVVLEPLDVPVAAVRVLAPGGALEIGPRTAGLGDAWARTVHRGAGALDGEAFHDRLDDLAADLSAASGLDAIGIAATAPSEHLLDLLDLAGDLFLDPHLTERDLDLVREELVDAVRTRADRPRQVAVERSASLRWAGHPWRLPAGGTVASLRRLRPRTLLAFHERHAVRGRLTVAVSGGFDPHEVIERLAWLDELPEPEQAPTPFPDPRPWRPGRHTVQAGARQSIVGLWGPGYALDDDRRHAATLLAAILNGQAGRLFLALREEQGLAYDLWARSVSRRDAGAFHLGLATDPSRAREAGEALRALVAEIAHTAPPVAELDHARGRLIGGLTLAHQRVEHRAGRLAWAAMMGLDPSIESRRDALGQVAPEQVAAEARRLVEADWVEVVTRPRTSS